MTGKKSMNISLDNMFYTYLKELGYDREVALEPFPELVEHYTDVTSGNHSMTISQFVTIWPNKDSYVYTGMYDDTQLGLSARQVQKNMSELMKDVRFEDQTRVVELGWKWKTPLHQDEYSMEGRHKLMWEFFKFARKDIANASWGKGYGIEGDTIVVYPFGDKNHFKTFTDATRELGTKQRQSMARRMGFGSLSEEGCMFATYSNGKLEAWTDE